MVGYKFSDVQTLQQHRQQSLVGIGRCVSVCRHMCQHFMASCRQLKSDICNTFLNYKVDNVFSRYNSNDHFKTFIVSLQPPNVHNVLAVCWLLPGLTKALPFRGHAPTIDSLGRGRGCAGRARHGQAKCTLHRCSCGRSIDRSRARQ